MVAAMQTLIIALLISVGFFLTKKNVLTEPTGKEMSTLLVNVVTPALILNSFQIEYTPEKQAGLLLTFALGFLSFAITIAFSFLFCGRGAQNKIERLSVTFSNAGFVGIPLVAGLYGSEGVFYASIFVITFNIVFWTYGISVLRGHFSKESLKKILLSPTILAVAAGLLLFTFHLRLPEPFSSVAMHLANLNTPLAMIVAGISIAQSDLLSILKNKQLYKTLVGKLIFAPILIALIFSMLPVSEMIRQIVILQVACPTAAFISIAALQCGLDNKTATEYFALTTPISIVTLPLIKLFCDFLF